MFEVTKKIQIKIQVKKSKVSTQLFLEKKNGLRLHLSLPAACAWLQRGMRRLQWHAPAAVCALDLRKTEGKLMRVSQLSKDKSVVAFLILCTSDTN